MVPDKFNFDRCLKIQSSKLHFQAYKHDLDIVTSRHMNTKCNTLICVSPKLNARL